MNPALTPWFSFCSMDSGERGRGGGDEMRVDLCLNTDFFTDKARPNCTLQPLHCNEKFIHAAGNHHWSRQNIRLVRTMIEHLLSHVTMLLSQVSSVGGIFRKSSYFVKTVTLHNISDRSDQQSFSCWKWIFFFKNIYLTKGAANFSVRFPYFSIAAIWRETLYRDDGQDGDG